MSYSEYKLTRTTPSQLRGIQESYYYDASDETLADVTSAGYFTGFPCSDDCETVITVNASDGWANVHPNGEGGASETVNALIGDKTAQEVSDGVDYSQKLKESNISQSNLSSASDRINLAATRRIDVVMLGDSNQRFGGYGFSRGFDKALSDRFGQYASPIYIGAEQDGYPGIFSQEPQFTDAVEPNHVDLFTSATTTTTTKTQNRGIGIAANIPLDTAQTTRFWLAWGGFPTGAGSFSMRVRYEDSPFSTLVSGASISTNTGDYALNLSFIDLPEGARVDPLRVKGGLAANITVTQPMTFFYQRAESINKENGVSVSTLYAQGGASLFDFADTILSYSDQQLTNYFAEVRRLQLSKMLDPIVVVYINSGFNDRNEASQPTKGVYQLTDSSSARGYIDNLSAVMNRIEGIWRINGWDRSELSFLLIASHVSADPNDATLETYREALKTLCNKRENLSTIDISELTTYAAGVSGGWYMDPITETIHLTQIGYDAVSEIILNGLVGS